jgi:hypothetical protein
MEIERYNERFDLGELYDITLPLCNTYALMGWESARRTFKNSLRNNVQIQGMSSYGARMYYWESFIGAYGDGWMKKECKITIEKLLNFDSVMESCDVYERASALKNMCIGDIKKTVTKIIGKDIGMRGEIREWSIEYIAPSIADKLFNYAFDQFIEYRIDSLENREYNLVDSDIEREEPEDNNNMMDLTIEPEEESEEEQENQQLEEIRLSEYNWLDELDNSYLTTLSIEHNNVNTSDRRQNGELDSELFNFTEEDIINYFGEDETTDMIYTPDDEVIDCAPPGFHDVIEIDDDQVISPFEEIRESEAYYCMTSAIIIENDMYIPQAVMV